MNKSAIFIIILIVIGAVILIYQDQIFSFFSPGAVIVNDDESIIVPSQNTISQEIEDFDDGAIIPTVPLSRQANQIIDITTIGFSPSETTIDKGDSIIWTNRDRNSHKLQATGAIYPEDGDCGSKLNSCAALKLGDSWKVTFNVSGEWNYRDELNPQFTGVVTVR
ncbi:MAG TPA: hypothetical protein VI432_01360 [Candidatus Paceibacterota bacterium]